MYSFTSLIAPVMAFDVATFQQALLNTVLGIVIVFVSLVFISFIIGLFKYISVFETKMKERKAAKSAKKAAAKANVKSEETVKAEAPVVEPVQAEEDDTALIAVITAAIYEFESALGNDVDNGLVVRSIKRHNQKGWQRA